ncbi:cold shock and DUF1294 domain-containing protein [Pelomonas sp. SE-A7]|uniref:cold shock and DUF1294 domain-containing protein n=1 Tax=Pelomonas sp. SE-A7 TaxID=3054953 RepID=UPI00259D1CDF|nr:cold shock and DUF1294 domain-containing protein [Pelomonas sp. SE-A7]MDM4765586.1 cold shock and DUF1294 domain-containing protein [Pelomonas sp. SE-A7]
MRKNGTLSQWDDAKGYGFITPEGGGGRLFVHIKAFGLRPRRPFVGERLSFEPGEDGQGKARALKVKSLEPRPAPVTPPPGARSNDKGDISIGLVPGFAALLLACHLLWPLPQGLWGFYMAMSMATFIVYGLDKRAARLNGWRVKEATLHGLALACGWPGALLAQSIFRHKSVKPSFRRWFWLTVLLNLLAFAWVFTPLGIGPWQRLWA